MVLAGALGLWKELWLVFLLPGTGFVPRLWDWVMIVFSGDTFHETPLQTCLEPFEKSSPCEGPAAHVFKTPSVYNISLISVQACWLFSEKGHFGPWSSAKR